jgi:hypothetical protein
LPILAKNCDDDDYIIYRHEALVAAIAEKDAHIALLEMSRDRPQDEIETLRRHKEKLIRKLKEEVCLVYKMIIVIYRMNVA